MILAIVDLTPSTGDGSPGGRAMGRHQRSCAALRLRPQPLAPSHNPKNNADNHKIIGIIFTNLNQLFIDYFITMVLADF